MKTYQDLVREEIGEWKKIEAEIFKQGIPWWVDLRRAKITGKNIFWRNDPEKEKIIRGNEKEELIRLASQKKGKVLDLGCGSGWLSLELGRHGMDVVGLDISPDRIRIAEKYLKTNPYKKGFGKIRYQVADLNSADFPDNSFDTVVVWDTLHHFPNLDDILIKVRRWLKPKGRFIVYDHIGHKLLKLGSKFIGLFLQDKKGSKIIPYEDVLGNKVITLIQKKFMVMYVRTCLSFPVSVLLFLLFGRDYLLPILPIVMKIDRILCQSRIFSGEYFFLYAINNKPELLLRNKQQLLLRNKERK